MFFRLLKNNTKKELNHIKREKKRCLKTYSDWEDDEYNCGPLKFIWALSSNLNPNFSTLNDLIVYYNRDSKKYLLDIDITKNFKSNDERRQYIENCQYEFRHYLVKNNLFDFNFDPFKFIYY